MNLSLATPRAVGADSAQSSAAMQRPAPLVYRPVWRLLILLGDVTALATAFGAGYLLVWRLLGIPPGLGACAVAAFVILAGFAAHDLHERTFAILRRDEFYYAAAVTLVMGAAIVAGCFVLDLHRASQLAVTLGVALSVVSTGVMRFAVRSLAGEQRVFAPESFERPERRVHVIVTDRARLSKRLADLALAMLALPVVVPVLVLATLAILAEDGGPVIYRQSRVGRDGRTFDIFKLRSMRVGAESKTGPKWALHGDDRVTHVGRVLRRLSIDELPQLINVLRGEMSIVGPRPERPVFIEEFSRSNPRYAYRLAVPPGLTACSHLYMPRNVDSGQIDRRLDYDLFYIRHRSLAMDVALVLKTAAEVAFHRAA
jgi:lipopolysaccharide/colanic/teichoic acid biosynthesis glycosyltransferase